MPRNTSCTRCILSKGCKSVNVWGEGKAGGVMLVGEGPGAEEDNEGRPFVGAAGKQLEGFLSVIGKKRTDVYLANVVKCRPPGNRAPETSEINACWPYLAEEIQTVEPKVIVCLGGSALKALTGQSSVAANRGKMVEPKKGIRLGDAKIIVTYHPAAVLHPRTAVEKERIRESIAADLRLAFEMADGTRTNQYADHRRALLPPGYSAATLTSGLKALGPCKVLACDLEWTALGDRGMSWPWSRGAELFSISLSGRVGEKIYSLAFSWPLPPMAEYVLQDFFKTHPMVFHNALADLNWLEYLKLPCTLGGDTLLLAFLMDEEQRLSLEQLAPIYTNVKPGWKIGPWEKPPADQESWLELLEYNSNDTYATLKLAEALHERLKKLAEYEREGIKKVYYKILLPVVPTMVRMALYGTPMDVEGVQRELKASKERSVEISEKIAALIGCNPQQAAALAGSPMQTLDYLREAYNLNIDSSRKDDLSDYENDYTIIKLIQAFRWERNKVQGTYLGPWYDLLLEQRADNVLHSVYRLTYARTGRTSAEIEKGGSLQLMPRNQDDRILRARNLVKARPGYKIIAADQSQVEIRIMAWLSGDKVMLRLFQEGADLHKAVVAFIKNQPMGLEEFWPRRDELMAPITKDERQGGKGINFGLLFGQQPPGLQEYSRNTYKVNMTLEQATAAHKGYFTMFEDVRTYQKYCETVVYQRGWTETPLGRFRRNIEEPTKAINTPIQTTASDLMLIAMPAIDRAFLAEGLDAHLCGFVHDSVLCEAREDQVYRAACIIKYEMEHPNLSPWNIELPIPLKADLTVGDTWGEAREIKDLSELLTNSETTA